MVDIATLKSKIISTDLVIKKFKEREAECNQLKTLKTRLESDCTTYERELKQVLGELLPTKKALEEFKKTNSDQNFRIKELEDELKASLVISEQYRELAKVKEAETEEYKGLATVEKDLKKKEQQLDKSKESNQKLQEEAKKNEQRLKKLQNSYKKALSVVEKLSEKLKLKQSLNKKEIKEIATLKKIVTTSKESEEDEDDDALALERMLQDGNDDLETSEKEMERAKENLSETEDVIDAVPAKSPKKTKMVISKSDVVMTTPPRKDEMEVGFQVFEHHSYSLSPILQSQKRKLSTSPKKVVNVQTNHLCGINKVKKLPNIIVDNGVCDSVTILNEENNLPEPKCETILNYCQVPTETKLDSASTDKSVMLLDPNEEDRSRIIEEHVLVDLPVEEFSRNLDCEMNDLTELKTSETVSSSKDCKSDTDMPNLLNSVSDSATTIVREIYDVVEYLVEMTCSDGNEESVSLLGMIHCDEPRILVETEETHSLSQTSQPESQNLEKIEDKPVEKETKMESQFTVTSTKFIDESASVEVKVVEDEFKTTLRRVRRLTRRISSSASFERPLSPMPPSPPPLSPISELEDNPFLNMVESASNLDILPSDNLDDLFGTDTEDDSDSLGDLVPPKPFQHQESQGFDSEFVSEEGPPNPLVERARRPSLQNPPCSPLASRRLSNSNMSIIRNVNQSNSSHQCPSSTITSATSENNSLSHINPENGLNNGRNDYVSNCGTTNESNAIANSNNFPESASNRPFNNFDQHLHQPKDFNSKLKADFSHNSSTGNYSISIRLPDSNNPVKNMHFEIDTNTNEFSLNFGPGSLRPIDDSCPTSSTEKPSYKPNPSSLKDSCCESMYDSGLNEEENGTRVSSISNKTFNKNNTVKRSSAQISPASQQENSSKKSKNSNEKSNSSQRPSLFKNSSSIAATVIKPPSQKFSPCNNSFINPKKSIGTPDRLQHTSSNLDKPLTNPSLNTDKQLSTSSLTKRPFLKNDSKSRKVLSDGSAPLSMNTNKEMMETLQPVDKLIDQGSKAIIVNKDTPKPSPKNDKSPLEKPTVLDPEIPILQPMLPKRISHCAKNEGFSKEMPILTKKTKVNQAETTPSDACATQKRKLSTECNEKGASDDIEQATKKICTSRYDNKELTRIRKFCKSTTKMLNKNSAIELVLQEMYKFDNTNDKVRKNVAQNIYTQLSNQKVVPNPKTLIDAILMFLSKVKKNPFIPTKKDFRFVSPFETGTTAFLYHLAKKIEGFKNLLKDFKDQALFFLFSNRKLSLNGSAAVCRLLTMICMHDGDYQTVRMFCFNLLKEQPKISLYLVANIISTWPQILAPNKNKPSILRDTFLKVLLNTETELNSTLKKYAMKPIRKFCEVNDENFKLNVDEIVKECVNNFLDQNIASSLLAETSRALEIIASYKSWDWRLKQLIYIELLPLVENNNLQISNSVALLKLIGTILSNYPPNLKKDVSTVIKVFLQLLTDEKTPEEIMEAALFNILHLKDLLENPQLEIVKFWIDNHRETLKPKFLINKFSVIETK